MYSSFKLGCQSKEVAISSSSYDVLKLAPFYKAFQVSADVPMIFCKIGNEKFEEPPLEKEILAFLASLGHSGEIRKIMIQLSICLHQPVDHLLLSSTNVSVIENKNTKKGNAMYYPRFTKLVVNFVMAKDPSIPRRNKVNWHYARDDPMFTTINVISRNKGTQLYGTILLVALTNEDIHNSESYKEYYAIASGKIPPKTKASKKKADTDATTKQKPPTVPKEKKGKKSRKGKQKAKDEDDQDDDKNDDDENAQDDQDDEKNDNDENAQDDQDDKKNDNDKNAQDDQDDEKNDDDENSQDDDDEEQTESEDDGDDFIHPKAPFIMKKKLTMKKVEGMDVLKEGKVLSNQGILKILLVTLTPVNPDGQQQSSSVSSGFVSNMLNPNQDTALEDNFSEFKQTNQYAEALSSIPGIVDQYLANKLKEAVDVAVQLKSDRIREEAQAENQQFLDSIDEGIKKAYKALVDAYEADKIMLDIMGRYGHNKDLEIGRDDDQRNPQLWNRTGGQNRRNRSGKEPESTSALREKTTTTAGKTTTGSKTHKQSASQSAPVEETMQSTKFFEAPAHQEFETGVHDEQPEEEVHLLPNWFQQPKRLSSPNHAWNKFVPADHESVQPWLSNLARRQDPRELFDELTDTTFDFSAFVMNRLNVTTLTPELLAGPTFELMKGTCKSLTELEYFCEEVYKATTEKIHQIIF
ncbi:hypothetical protein Tco_0859851 [Tanacetum coccineum]|uniref:Uncharacterized protein n=1 Tax=Tanacetum coccineum TaxID=301880 RepID=A0ABQ5BH74_9ASTR